MSDFEKDFEAETANFVSSSDNNESGQGQVEAEAGAGANDVDPDDENKNVSAAEKTDDEGEASDDASAETPGEKATAQEPGEEANNIDDVDAKLARMQKKMERKIGRVVGQRNEAQARLKKLEAQIKESANADDNENSTDAEQPDPLDYDNYDDYVEAEKNWKAKQAESKKTENKNANAESEQELAESEFMEVLDRVKESFDDAADRYEDFDEKIVDKGLAMTPDMIRALDGIDNAGEVAYHLANNHKSARQIAGLSTRAIERAIDRLSLKIETGQIKINGSSESDKKAKAKKKTTSAPDPIQPLAGKAAAEGKSLSEMDFSEFEETMNQRERKKSGWV